MFPKHLIPFDSDFLIKQAEKQTELKKYVAIAEK